MSSLVIKGSHDELTSLDSIIKNTVKTLENGREHLFTVAENARNECIRLNSVFLKMEEQLVIINDELTAIEESEKVKLILLKEEYYQLELKKKELETNLLGVRKTAEKAENMVSQVGVVIDFIKGNLRNINIKLESLQQKQQMGLQIVSAQEEERKRVAREIHDGPAQSMANIVLRLEFCEKLMDANPNQVRDEIKELKGIVRNTLQDVRKIIFDLRPMALDDLGFIPALKRYIEDFRKKHDISVDLNFYGRETRLESVLEIALFRLIQEALNNVIKHACASNVKIDIEMKTEWVKTTVQDNGLGFDLEEFLTGDTGIHFGLRNMKERIDLLGGEMDIETKPGKGTKVSFKVPVTR